MNHFDHKVGANAGLVQRSWDEQEHVRAAAPNDDWRWQQELNRISFRARDLLGDIGASLAQALLKVSAYSSKIIGVFSLLISETERGLIT